MIKNKSDKENRFGPGLSSRLAVVFCGAEVSRGVAVFFLCGEDFGTVFKRTEQVKFLVIVWEKKGDELAVVCLEDEVCTQRRWRERLLLLLAICELY